MKKFEPYNLSIFDLTQAEKHGYLKYISGLVSEHPLVVNVLTGPTLLTLLTLCNQRVNTAAFCKRGLSSFFHHSDINIARKCPSYLDLKS